MPEITQRHLEEYLAQKRELLTLEERIKQERQKAEMLTTDVVKGSSPNFPYVKTTYTITGIDVAQINHTKQLLGILERRKTELQEDQIRIEEFISRIPESIIRQIVELRYIRGMSWGSLATIIYGHPCGDRCRMRLERYFMNKK